MYIQLQAYGHCCALGMPRSSFGLGDARVEPLAVALPQRKRPGPEPRPAFQHKHTDIRPAPQAGGIPWPGSAVSVVACAIHGAIRRSLDGYAQGAFL